MKLGAFTSQNFYSQECASASFLLYTKKKPFSIWKVEPKTKFPKQFNTSTNQFNSILLHKKSSSSFESKVKICKKTEKRNVFTSPFPSPYSKSILTFFFLVDFKYFRKMSRIQTTRK